MLREAAVALELCSHGVFALFWRADEDFATGKVRLFTGLHAGTFFAAVSGCRFAAYGRWAFFGLG